MSARVITSVATGLSAWRRSVRVPVITTSSLGAPCADATAPANVAMARLASVWRRRVGIGWAAMGRRPEGR